MISNGRVPDKILYLGVQKFDFLFQLNYLEFLFKRLLPCLFLLNLKRHFLLLKDLLQTFDVFFMNAFLRFNFVFLLLQILQLFSQSLAFLLHPFNRVFKLIVFLQQKLIDASQLPYLLRTLPYFQLLQLLPQFLILKVNTMQEIITGCNMRLIVFKTNTMPP